MPDWIPKLLKLIEDDIGWVLLQLPTLVINFFHVGLTTRSGNNLGTDLAQPLEPFLRHFLGKDSDRRAPEKSAIEGASPAKVAG